MGLGLLTLSVVPGAEGNAAAAESWVYFGTYTGGKSRGIHVSRFNHETGVLGQAALVAEMTNPSFLAVHPNGRQLYAVGETADSTGRRGGTVAAFQLDAATGGLKPLSTQDSHGSHPCHLTVDRTGRWVLVANYSSGTLSVFPVAEDGSLGSAKQVIQHSGSSVNTSRQMAPHAHSIQLDPRNRHAIAADLGIDKLMVYDFDAKTGQLEPNQPPFASLAPGSGPRHFAFHPDGRHLFAINEMLTTITAFSYDGRQGRLKELGTVPTLPGPNPGDASTAEILVHPTGRFVYGSNRGHHSIVVYRFDRKTSALTLVEHESTGGKTPRNFVIDPTGRWLLAENQDSDSVVVFAIDADTGALTPTGQRIEVGSPVCARFVAVR
jgi:6-phosphogluconolactonase